MRLGIDIGTNSIGWWLYITDGDRIAGVVDGGVRIFSDGRDPKSGASRAVGRRTARAMRRRRDRYLRRRAALMKRLAEAGLMPTDPGKAKELEALDPYQLRAEGLDRALPLPHLGRALFHINQRRGFRSNRKTDRGDNESGKIRDATARLDQAMMATGARTYGEFLHLRRSAAPDPRQTPSVRTRLTIAHRGDSEKDEAGYDFYPGRRHLMEEFARLWAAQATHRPDILSEELRAAVHEIIFHQRPLKEPQVGRCLFIDEPRLPKAHPLTQQRTLYETINNLRITGDGRRRRPLTREQRDQIVHLLDNKKPTKSLSSMTMTLKALARALNLPPDERFTLESLNRDAIACDPVRASLSHPDRFGPNWSKLDERSQWEVIARIRQVETDADHTALVDWLMSVHDLNQENADTVARAPLPEGYSRLGETATRRILDALRSDVLTYDQAAAACGWHHSDGRSGEALDALPYYGAILDRHVIPGSFDPNDDEITRYGRITNPTVHIGLNQLRRLVNRIIATYGKPDQIVVELARELKQSEEQKREIQRAIKRNTDDAVRRGKLLEEMSIANTGANRKILRLWEDLGNDIMLRSCPYSGKRISAAMLFDGSCEVDHILPYSRTLDDSFANQTLCLREANREKSNQSPWEAWGGTPAWDRIAANLNNLPENKRWRFAPDAMARFEGERGFIDRALVDTQYLSSIARAYLDALYTQGGHVWVVPGRLTEMLRRHWGLNALLPDHVKGTAKAKNRTDHRHHAIDACVVAATDRSLVKRISDAAKRDEDTGAEEIARSIDPPWDGFRVDIEHQLGKIIVSHRADHGRIDPEARKRGRDSTTGQLHNDTAYGLTREVRNGVPLVVTRKPLDTLTHALIDKIRDPDLRQRLRFATDGKEGKDFTAALAKFAADSNRYRGIRRVRLVDAVEVIGIKDRNGRVYKGYKPDSNHCYEVWRLPNGDLVHHVIPTFAAHQRNPQRPHPAARRLLKLHKNDMVRLENSKFGPVIATVEKFDGNGAITLVAHNESNADQRYRKDKEDVFIRLRPASLHNAGARRVIVDEMGRVSDPGPPK
mgnify:CR=1 FL=1